MKNSLAYMIERSAQFYKNNTAVIFENEMYSFEEIHLLSNALKQGLNDLAVKKGERVGVLLPNSAAYIITDFSLIKGGYVRVPLNTRLAIPELEYIINDSEMSVVVYDHEYEERVKQMRPNLKTVKHFISVGSEEGSADVRYEDILGKKKFDNNYEEFTEKDHYQILYTSGTTGKPKGALTNVLSRLTSLNNVFIDEITIDSTDAMMHVASLAHGGGTKVLPHFVKGATNILMNKFSVEAFLDYLEKYKFTTTWMVPTMVGMLIEDPKIKEHDLSSLKTIIYAGAPMPVAVLEKAIEIFGNIFIQVYGLSEAPNPDLVLTKKDHLKGLYERPQILSSAGREILNGRVEIIDEEEKPVKVGEIGEIIIKGDNIMSEYWKLPEETSDIIKNGWLFTGDLAKKDEEGYIYIVDRSKDMIISGGYNIYPREIEEVLYQHEAILEAAVIGISDERWGECVQACISLRGGFTLTEEEVIQYCQKYLASFKKPKKVDFYNELPKNSNGKILKKELKENYNKALENVEKVEG